MTTVIPEKLIFLGLSAACVVLLQATSGEPLGRVASAVDQRTRRPGGHVFVDETKSKDYIMVAASVEPSEVAAARKRLRALLLPGQERIHFTHEKDARRRQIINEMSHLDMEVHIFVARTRNHILGRRVCLEASLETVLIDRAHIWCWNSTSQWLGRTVGSSQRDSVTSRARLNIDICQPRANHCFGSATPWPGVTSEGGNGAS